MQPKRMHASLLTAIVAFTYVALAAVLKRQDANWDLRNYHLYTPMALMQGRLDTDIAAAQMQTFHNPTLDFPLAWLVSQGAPGLLVAAWLALPAFVALYFALRMMDRLWPTKQSTFRLWIAGLATAGGAAVLPSIGSSFNDAFVAAAIVPALWWVVDSHGRRSAWMTWLPVGLLAGAAAGLKLTGAIYCVGFIAAAVVAGPLRSLPVRILGLATGGLVGFVIFAGPWAWRLWVEHGNPLFPYFNQWVQSPDALHTSYKDLRLLPVGWYDKLMVPIHLLKISRQFAENKLADPRMLLGFIALVIWSVQWLRARKHSAAPNDAIAPWPVIAFVLVSYACWVQLYGIYRYLFALEVVMSITIIGVLSTLLPQRFYKTLMIVALVLMLGATRHPGWGRQAFRTPMISVVFPTLADNAMVLIAEDHPVAHAVPFLPRDVPAIAVYNNFMDPKRCTRLQARAESRITAHQGSFYLLRQVSKGVPETGGRFEDYGFSLAGDCLKVEDSLRPVELCPLQRTHLTPVLCPLPAPGH